MLINCCILLDFSVWIVLWCTDPRTSGFPLLLFIFISFPPLPFYKYLFKLFSGTALLFVLERAVHTFFAINLKIYLGCHGCYVLCEVCDKAEEGVWYRVRHIMWYKGSSNMSINHDHFLPVHSNIPFISSIAIRCRTVLTHRPSRDNRITLSYILFLYSKQATARRTVCGTALRCLPRDGNRQSAESRR